MSYKIKFITDDEEINTQNFEFDGSNSIEYILINFIMKTHFKFNLDANDFLFVYNNVFLLNKEKNLKKTVSDIFKNKRENIYIKVSNFQNVIG